MNIPTLLTVKQFSDKHPSFPTGGLRDLIFKQKENGLKTFEAIIKMGKKVLIHEERFFEWVMAHSKQKE